MTNGAPAERKLIENFLGKRLLSLIDELGINVDDARYRQCLQLLADAGGAQVLRILKSPPKHAGGAPAVWTVRRHAELVEALDARLRKGLARKEAIGEGRDQFSVELSKPHMKDGTIKAQYHRAKNFFSAVPVTAAEVLSSDQIKSDKPGAATLKFLAGCSVLTKDGYLKLTPDARWFGIPRRLALSDGISIVLN
jgi:hypothetical protein